MLVTQTFLFKDIEQEVIKEQKRIEKIGNKKEMNLFKKILKCLGPDKNILNDLKSENKVLNNELTKVRGKVVDLEIEMKELRDINDNNIYHISEITKDQERIKNLLKLKEGIL
jgi:hypothetical protein